LQVTYSIINISNKHLLDDDAENNVSDIKAVINKMYVTHPTIIENKDLTIEEDIYEKNVNILHFVQ